MSARMKRLPIAAILAMSIVGSWALVAGPAAAAEEARPISTAQLQKILKFVDTIGALPATPTSRFPSASS
jgi:hypothetical protein